MYAIEDLAGLFEHGVADQRTVNAVFGAIFQRYNVNLQLVWERLVEDVGFDGKAEVFVISPRDAFHVTESVRAWIFGETTTSPGDPGTWAGPRVNFEPSNLIGDGQHNLAGEWN